MSFLSTQAFTGRIWLMNLTAQGLSIKPLLALFKRTFRVSWILVFPLAKIYLQSRNMDLTL